MFRADTVHHIFLRLYGTNPKDYGIRFVERPGMEQGQYLKYAGKSKFYVSEKYLNLGTHEQELHLKPSVVMSMCYNQHMLRMYDELAKFVEAIIGSVQIAVITRPNISSVHFLKTKDELYHYTQKHTGSPHRVEFRHVYTETSVQPIVIEAFGFLSSLFVDSPLDFDVKLLVDNINDTLISLDCSHMTIFTTEEGYVFKYFGSHLTVYRKDDMYYLTDNDDHPMCRQCKLLDMMVNT